MDPGFTLFLIFIFPLYLVMIYYLVIAVKAYRSPRRLAASRSEGCRGCSLEVVIPIKNEPIGVVEKALRRNMEAFTSASCISRVVVLSDDDAEYVGCLKREIGGNGLVEVVRRENPKGGRTGALDSFFSASRSSYILVLDADAVVDSSTLEALCREIGGEDAYVIPWRGYAYEKTRVAEAMAFFTNLGTALLYKLRWRAGFFIFPLGSGTAYRRSTILEVGGWGDNVIQDDIFMGVKLATTGHRTALLENGEVKVLVPSRLHALRKQQSRWAYGTSEVLAGSIRRLAAAKLPWSTKLEMVAYMMHPLHTLPTFTAFLLAPAIALAQPVGVSLRAQLLLVASLVVPLVLLSTIYGYLMYRLVPEIYEGGFKQYLVNLGRFAAILTVLSPHLSVSAVKGLLRTGYRWEVTPKGEKEKQLPREKTPHLITVWALIGAILSLIARNFYTFAISASYLIAAVYSLLRLEL
ncbi:glycosyltransferase family 2 protein [Infirmifilum sp. SLHALR2]|nr:MAG: hypothetical protein B7L53_05945 [Thermofilum sp. NZ13]